MGFLMESQGPITVELRRESFIIHHDDPAIESVEYENDDLPYLIDALTLADNSDAGQA